MLPYSYFCDPSIKPRVLFKARKHSVELYLVPHDGLLGSKCAHH